VLWSCYQDYKEWIGNHQILALIWLASTNEILYFELSQQLLLDKYFELTQVTSYNLVRLSLIFLQQLIKEPDYAEEAMEGDQDVAKESFIPVYKMNKKKLGQVVIFNNKEFDDGTLFLSLNELVN